MKKRIFALILAFASLLLCSCEKGGELTDLGFKDPNTGIEYVYCTPMGLYPVDPDEEFIRVEAEGSETVYYKVYFEDPSEFLCYEDSGYYFLMRNADIAEPTVAEFNPIAAAIYGSTNTVKIDNFYADNQYLPEDKQEHSSTEDSWLCQLIAKQLTEGEAVDVPVTPETITDLYYIRLLSQDYPGLYYLVPFFGYNGRYFLRDGAHGKTVYCPNDVIARMVGE